MKKTSLPKDKQLSEKEILQHEFLTIAEVALLLRVTERTVYNFIYAGTLKAHKITSRITIIPKSNFLEMLRLSEYNKKLLLSNQREKTMLPLPFKLVQAHAVLSY